MTRLFMIDFDGTIADSLKYWWELPEEYIRHHSLRPKRDIAEKAWYYDFKGLNRFFAEEYGIAEGFDAMCEVLNSIMKNHYIEDVALKRGSIELLEFLKEKGNEIALVTNTSEAVIRPCLERFRLYDYFSYVASSFDTGMSKKETAIFEKVLKHYHADPKNSVLIDDSLPALRSARTVGMITAGVYDPYSEDYWETIELEADLAIEDLSTFDPARFQQPVM